MKNIYEVLRQKEAEIQQLEKDIEALRVAARLLADEDDSTDSLPRSSVSSSLTPIVRASAPVSVAVAAPPVVRPAAPIAPSEGYSASRDNSLRQFP